MSENKVTDLAAARLEKGKVREKTRAKTERRLAWSGLTREELSREGSVLLASLYQTANNRGIQITELAEELGVTYGYIAQLKQGVRKTSNISTEFVNACAKFLGWPRLQVMLAAGKLNPRDFYEDVDTLDTYVEEAIHYIMSAPYGDPLPADILKASSEVKLYVVRLYERARGRVLIPTEHEMTSIVKANLAMLKLLRDVSDQ